MGKQTNYYISDLIKQSTKKQKLLILSEIYEDIKKLSINDYGTHPIQTFIERASSKEEISLITNSISNQNTFIKLSTDKNGTYVVQKILLFFNEQFRPIINTLILNNILTLSVDMSGVRVVQKFYFYMRRPSKFILYLQCIQCEHTFPCRK